MQTALETGNDILVDRLLYYAAVGKGGLSDYAVHQVEALANAGISIVCVGFEHLKKPLELRCPQVEFILLPEPSDQRRSGGRIGRVISWIQHTIRCTRQLCTTIRQEHFQYVLFAAYAEYWSPFWVWPLRRLAKQGVHFGVVIHDPIRDFRVGPRWWHLWSISLAYSFVEIGFVHDGTQPDLGWPKRNLETAQIPHGLYGFPMPEILPSPETARNELKIPLDAKVILSFGHIRDGKNLDLAIKALADYPQYVLVVAGREQSSTQRPASYYQDLAREHSVADRCYWFTGFIPDADVWKFFVASDLVLLTYSAQFRSASGVLNVAAPFKKPVLASGGDGPLKQIVARYHLGLWCEPDSERAIHDSLGRFLQFDSNQLEWSRYESDHTWEKNAVIVLSRLTGGPSHHNDHSKSIN